MHKVIITNLSKYIGQWVVVCNHKVIAHNKDLTKIKQQIDDCKETPTVVKIPEKDILIFYQKLLYNHQVNFSLYFSPILSENIFHIYSNSYFFNPPLSTIGNLFSLI